MNEEEVKLLAKQRNLSQINDNLIRLEILKLQNESNLVAGKAFCFSHFQYIKYTTKGITFEDAAFYTNASYVSLKSSSSLSLFKKPSFKDRISHLIFYFNNNPGIFSQVLYFTLTGVDIVFNKDDYIYFLLHTIPSLYSYFIDKDEANNAIELIKITLRYHFSLNKSSIKKDIQNNQNEFITFLIRGFISGSNPSSFFRYLDIDEKLFPLENKKYFYSKVNGKLVRADYWKSVLKTAILIVEKMIAGINLLPSQICKLFSVLNEVNSDFTDFYIFGIFFHDYISNKNFCDVIDCSYRQGLYNRTALYNAMEGIWDINPLRLKLQQLKIAILTNQNPQQFNFESDLILSTRDINLLLRIASFSIQNLNALGFDDLANLCDNLNNVFKEVSDRIVINLKKWCFVSKFSYQNEDNFPMTYELLELNPDKEKIKNIFRPFLTIGQMMQIDSYNKTIFNDELTKVNSLIEKSQKVLDTIYETEIFVEELKKALSYDLIYEVSTFFENRVAKSFIYYNSKTIIPLYQNIQLPTINEGITKLYNFLYEWSKFMKLNTKAQKSLNRAIFDQFFGYFVNRVAFKFTFDLENQKMYRAFQRYKGPDKNLPLNIQKACKLFMRISMNQTFKINLYNIINATMKLKKDTDKEVILAIARSKNKALFWFGELIVRMLTEKTIKDRIFNRNENEAIAIFLNGLIVIEKQ